MTATRHETIRREHYRPPDYRIPTVHLAFDIDVDRVRVTATLDVERTEEAAAASPFVLDGVDLQLTHLAIDDRDLTPASYTATDRLLSIPHVPASFTLKSTVQIDPWNNTTLEGLYKSGEILCTQNEPQGFRHITYFPDRPDVMSVFTTTITADPERFPTLLANGNLEKSEELPDGRVRVTWHDPFPKPCYLFALVAGDLGMVEDHYRTGSGRDITLRIYVDQGNENRTQHALDSLKKAMRWDEDTFGLEYDLDLYMIVAVDAFNFGAMENKGLNIFNSQCCLASDETATDSDYVNIEAIVAHEYFHNWTGNRVTLRDWFQLTLKEGLTIYRDSEFTSDMHSRPVKRISDARSLREGQFTEDAGPNAHPIRPESYIEINNFYTSTVYSKGSEVIRMLAVLLGKETFRRGIDRYFELFDGHAATANDFVHAMELASGRDLTQFRRWYAQAGTPVCAIRGSYEPQQKAYTLTVQQSCPPTADGSPKEPFVIPMTVGLLDPDGNDMQLQLAGESRPGGASRVLVIDRPQHRFTFTNLPHSPVPSLFRDFSAPVRIRADYSDEQLAFLLTQDSDLFNRFDAGQMLATRMLCTMMEEMNRDGHCKTPPALMTAFSRLLTDEALDRAFCVGAVAPPTITALNQDSDVFDVDAAHLVREQFLLDLARQNEQALINRYAADAEAEYRLTEEAIAKRALRALILSLLTRLSPRHADLALEQFNNANNMTESLNALSVLCQLDNCPQRDEALGTFRERWKDNFVVLNKWFALQAGSRRTAVYDDLLSLARDPLFDSRNPNRQRSLYGAFAGNLPAFHHVSGRGYKLIADVAVETDDFNPTMAAAYGKAFKLLARLDEKRRALAQQELERVMEKPRISPGLYEVVSKTLEQVG